MQSASFRFFAAVVTILLFTILILIVSMVLRSDSTAEPSNPDREIAITRSATLDSSEEISWEVPEGGFKFRSLPGYDVELSNGSANMTADDAVSDVGPFFLLSGGLPSQIVLEPSTNLSDNFAQFIDHFSEEDNFLVSAQFPYETDEMDGLVADIHNRNDGEGDSSSVIQFSGRIFMAQPRSEQLFLLVGIAPTERWQQHVETDFELVLKSVSILELNLPEMTATAITGQRASVLAGQNPESLFPLDQTTNIPPSVAATQTLTIPSQPTPTMTASPPVVEKPVWRHLTNGNYINDLGIANEVIWAATDGGVVVWNLATDRVTKFTTQNGVSTNQMFAVAVCPIRELGVVFATKIGLQIFHGESGSWRILNSRNSAMAFDHVIDIECHESEGLLTVVYEANGLDVFDVNTDRWQYIDRGNRLLSATINGIGRVVQHQEIWLATSAGALLVYQNDADDFTTELFTTANSPLVSNDVLTIDVDEDGTVWLGGAEQLYQIKRTAASEAGVVEHSWTALRTSALFETEGREEPSTGPLVGLAAAMDGTIWIASQNGQICRFDPLSESCLQLIQNQTGQIERAGQELGRQRLTGLKVSSDESLYYTTNGAGFSRFSKGDWQNFQLSNDLILGNQIFDIEEDESGVIWIASNGGVQQIDVGADIEQARARFDKANINQGDRFRQINSNLFSDEIRIIEPDGQGGIWFGADGAGYFDGATWTTYSTLNGLVGRPVQAMTIDANGRTWIGTPEGLSIVSQDSIFNLTRSEGLPDNHILTLYAERRLDGKPSSGNVVWFGTKEGGSCGLSATS
ncbi:hypothetical protein KFU94_37765 [Chloroflexi bacterium TSY]|nr:hypothetical protein [Chloroflexi bacterium TSY]